ncbi:amino acid ABC transporter permease [Erysipelotrichaceae bacterium]|nr:amino acid ABC transporter permease [Erysipelotrichaceae bacterium]
MAKAPMRKIMKIALTVLLSTVFLLAAAGGNLHASSSKKYTIATDTTYAPFEFQDVNGNIIGIDVELLAAIAKEQNFTYELKPLGFNAAVQALESGQVDAVIAGMTITEARIQKFDFTEPYFESGIVMGIHASNTKIKGYADLKGQNIAVKLGTVSADFAEKNKEKYGYTITAFDETANMYEDVKSGNAQALFEDYPVLAYGITQGNGLKIVTAKEPSGSYGVAVQKGKNAEFLKSFNEGLAKIEKNGIYKKITEQYLGEQPKDIIGSPDAIIGAKVVAVKGKNYGVATDTTYAPFEFQTEQGDFTGIDLELLAAIAADQEFTYDLKPLGFNAAVQALESGQVDAVIAGMTITDARKQKFDFSKAYFESGISMGVREDNDAIKTYADLKGQKVAVKIGTVSADFAEANQEKYGFNITKFDETANMYEDVKSGNAQALFEDYPVLAYGITQGNGLKIIGEKEPGGEYGIAIKKGGTPELLEALNQGLENIIASGEYQSILDKYLNSEPTQEIKGNTFFSLIGESYTNIIAGLATTLYLTFFSLIIALIIGLLLGLCSVSTNRILNGIATIYIDIMRGIPLLVLAFMIYNGIPNLLNIKLAANIAGIITLSLNAAAYIAEIVRGGIEAVDSGQMEAARSLGLPYGKTMRRVILPQAIRIMTPSFVNQFVITLKDTSILSVIGIVELTQTGKLVIARNFESFKMWTIIAVVYIIIITVLTKLSKKLEKRVKNG